MGQIDSVRKKDVTLHCCIHCVKFRVGIDEKCEVMCCMNLSDELWLIYHLAVRQDLFSCHGNCTLSAKVIRKTVSQSLV